MRRIPPWVASSTRPTTAEVERLVGGIDPELVSFARDATAPRPAEVAALRRRKPKRSVHSGLTAFAVVVVGAAAIGLLVAEPELLVVTERSADPGIYRVTAAEDLSPIHGVWVRGEGSVEVGDDGGLMLSGDLLLTVTSPVVFAVGDHTFSARDAVVWVDGTGLRVASGRVEGETEVLTVGERWSPPVAVLEVRPVPVPVLLPLPLPLPVSVPVSVPEAAPAPVSVPEAAPAPDTDAAAVTELTPTEPAEVIQDQEPTPDGAPSAALAWRDVLVRLEQGGTPDDRIAALRSYRARFPTSPFAPEAEVLMLVIRGTDGDPRERLAAVEQWLGRNPDAPRAVELHALAARIARERLHDCTRAEPHDRLVVARTVGATRAKGQAFLGLCAIASGRAAEGRELLEAVDPELLDPTLQRAIADTRKADEPPARRGEP